jgi:hypothetical protein
MDDDELRAIFARGPAAVELLVRELADAPLPVRTARRAACLARGHQWRPIGRDADGAIYGCVRCGGRRRAGE